MLAALHYYSTLFFLHILLVVYAYWLRMLLQLGNRLCKETDFMEKMKNYIWSSIIKIDEFERRWEEVLKEFNLENNNWLQYLYSLRAS